MVQSLNTLLLRKPILLHAKTNDKNGNITSSKNMKNKVDTLIDDNNNKTSFKIVYKRRNHDKSLRNTMKQLADEIDENKHIVNLDKPGLKDLGVKPNKLELLLPDILKFFKV